MGRILICLCAVALVVLFWTEASTYPGTAARLPDLLGWVVLVLALMGIVQEVFALRREAAMDGGGVDPAPAPQWRYLATGAAFLGLVVLYAWSINEIGYLVATPLFMLVPFLVLRPIGVVAAIATTAAVTAFIWVVFVWFLNLSIPLYPAF